MNDTKKLEDLHPVIQETLAVHEAFRRMGFNCDDMFFVYDNKGQIEVKLQPQPNKMFQVHVGTLEGLGEDPISTINAMWDHAITIWNESSTEEDKLKLWTCSHIRGSRKEVMRAMLMNGILVPANRTRGNGGVSN